MSILLWVLAGWAALVVVVAGLFVAVIRGGGGTEATPLDVEPTVAVPGQRSAGQVSAPVAQVAVDLPDQRSGAATSPLLDATG